MLNSVGARPKSSKLERVMNRQIVVIFIVQNIMCVLCAFYSLFWLDSNFDELNSYLLLSKNSIYTNGLFYWIVKYGNWLLIFT